MKKLIHLKRGTIQKKLLIKLIPFFTSISFHKFLIVRKGENLLLSSLWPWRWIINGNCQKKDCPIHMLRN